MVVLKFVYEVKPKSDVYFYVSYGGLFAKRSEIFIHKTGLFSRRRLLGFTKEFSFRCFVTEKSLFVSNFLREVQL